jgi:hypothetical protein
MFNGSNVRLKERLEAEKSYVRRVMRELTMVRSPTDQPNHPIIELTNGECFVGCTLAKELRRFLPPVACCSPAPRRAWLHTPMVSRPAKQTTTLLTHHLVVYMCARALRGRTPPPSDPGAARDRGGLTHGGGGERWAPHRRGPRGRGGGRRLPALSGLRPRREPTVTTLVLALVPALV